MNDAEYNPTPFSTLALRAELLNNLTDLGYESMTPIQAESLPLLLTKHDLIAQANTGTGKTVAFGLTLLQHLNTEKYAVQTLILCPTRELADQVSKVIRKLARLMSNIKVLNLSGGAPINPQYDSLRHGAHIVVGTPGRIQKHLEKESLSLKHVHTLILDEADRMLDMGFFDAIKAIIDLCPKPRQTLLFSATYPPEIKKLAGEFMTKPKHIVIAPSEKKVDIEQRFHEVNSAEKFQTLKKLLLHYQPTSALIFCNLKEQTMQLASQLNKEGFSAIALNGDMEQSERDIAMIRFSNQSCSLLIATDVAARGLDIQELPAVINYDLAFERDVHTHRIGRTGRAGSKGLALSITTPADAERLCAIEDQLGHALTWGKTSELTPSNAKIPVPPMVTLRFSAGKKDKIRPGDILGALTKEAGLPANLIGKIDIAPLYSCVAIHSSIVEKAFQYFQNGKLKGRKVLTRLLR